MTGPFRVSYEITPAALNDASRLHGATFLRRYRVVMGLISLAGLVIAVVVDPALGIGIVLFGILMLAMTWMESLDRWLLGNRGRGIVGGTNEYVMDDAGIHYTNAMGSGLFGWSAFTTVRSSDKSIVLGRDRSSSRTSR